MVIEYIRYKINLPLREDFVAAYAAASEALNASPYCLAYELSECEEEPGQFILRIEWTSTEEHMSGFRKSEVFPPFFAHVKPFFTNIQEMRHYTVTDVAGTKSFQKGM